MFKKFSSYVKWLDEACHAIMNRSFPDRLADAFALNAHRTFAVSAKGIVAFSFRVTVRHPTSVICLNHEKLGHFLVISDQEKKMSTCDGKFTIK